MTDKKFGLTMSGAFAGLFCLFLFKERTVFWLLWISIGFLLASFFAPKSLAPIHIFWMKFGSLLGWLNSRLMLTALFYLVLTPIGLLMKIFRKNTLERRRLPKAPSYWHRKETQRTGYERQF